MVCELRAGISKDTSGGHAMRDHRLEELFVSEVTEQSFDSICLKQVSRLSVAGR